MAPILDLLSRSPTHLLSVASLAAEDNCSTAFSPTASNNALRYAVRVLARAATVGIVQQIVSAFVGADLLSIVRDRKSDRSAYDSTFYTAVFQTAVCPDTLSDAATSKQARTLYFFITIAFTVAFLISNVTAPSTPAKRLPITASSQPRLNPRSVCPSRS